MKAALLAGGYSPESRFQGRAECSRSAQLSSSRKTTRSPAPRGQTVPFLGWSWLVMAGPQPTGQASAERRPEIATPRSTAPAPSWRGQPESPPPAQAFREPSVPRDGSGSARCELRETESRQRVASSVSPPARRYPSAAATPAGTGQGPPGPLPSSTIRMLERERATGHCSGQIETSARLAIVPAGPRDPDLAFGP